MISRRKVLVVSLVAMAVMTTAAIADQALAWNRIGKGGLDGPYNALQRGVDAACLFNGKLYCSTSGDGTPAQIWQYDGKSWILAYKSGSGNNRVTDIRSLAVLGDYLYAGLNFDEGACQVWRTRGTGKAPCRWSRVSGPSNIESSYNEEIDAMGIVKGYLYVGTRNNYGCQVWRYSGSAWSQMVGQGPAGSPTGPGFGNRENYAAISIASSEAGDLYVGTSRSKGAEVWRMNKSGWAKLNKSGFGTADNTRIPVLVFFNNSLYAGTDNYNRGCQVWKYIGPNASNWKAVGQKGLGDPKNAEVSSATVFGNPSYLYFITRNSDKGCLVLRTDGKKWEKVNTAGFGEGQSSSKALLVFDGKLFAGTGWNGARIYATSGGAKIPFAWTQVNQTGFTLNDNEEIRASAFFGGKLYVGTYNGLGCEVWRYEGSGWTQVAAGGFGDPDNEEATSMAVANGYLYVGTLNWETGAEIWRYNGSKWTQANKGGFGDHSTNMASAMIVHLNKLYVGTRSDDTKAKVWRCDGLGASQWTKVNTNGFGVSQTVGVQSFAVFDNKLYAGTLDYRSCRVWRYDGPGPTGWTAVSDAGFGVEENYAASGLAVYKGALYAATWKEEDLGSGCEVYRYLGTGTGWSKVNVSGFGKNNNYYADSLTVFKNLLYVGTWNESKGGEIWSYDGSVWSQANKTGFGTSDNIGIVSFASDETDLYAGTYNETTGGEVWTTGPGSASPLIWRASSLKFMSRPYRPGRIGNTQPSGLRPRGRSREARRSVRAPS